MPAVPYSLPSFIALLLLEAVAEELVPVAVLDMLLELVEDALPALEDPEAPAPIAVAFFLPHMKLWQKVWPVRSLG